MSRIEIRNLVKMYGAHKALHGIDISIQPGEFCVLVGPSGCGKSTTLRMVAGLETISGGEIAIGERVVNGLRPKERGIAMVFQNYALYPSKTVYNNMAFSLQLSRMPRDEIDRRVREVAEILELTPLLDRKPGALSGGQRQRVAMGRAIVRDPEVFLFDEPLSNLDAKLRGQMRAEIKRLHQRLENTIIYVTHDQVEAMTLADRIVIMRDGRIEQQGTPDQIFHDPDTVFVAGFMGSPPMNLVECMVTPTGLKLGQNDIACATPSSLRAGDSVICGIRPDDIRPSADLPAGASITLPVNLIEQLGTEKLVHFMVGEHALIGKTGGRTSLTEGAAHPLSFDMAHAYFFDPKTEKRIR
ncbi:sn-glycerol-3-phosphate ABC transporter ATP-binding protein UgpC [Paracoccus sp. Z330]|uniref:Sn-glycerol-3-phosphate ABC transporter ATP-binding protein UgpC n=1 Tax=Paracoccus onchidii TaxID=3017813 RepID=A0ABT4ZJ71_9RHOB|nr:sn-glycerol-3-phosphate ABC transporter ATP-binding protein UgpC [Paracoccus onchidii]MDB6179117.1 sn-glycerol-3-phosphate ABC transporter ATP-binding protein UgpC [Paracoccus onchidii]